MTNHYNKKSVIASEASRQSDHANVSLSLVNAQQLPDKVPLTCAQQEKWLGGHYTPEAEQAFSESFELILDGDLDVVALDNAIAQVVARHDVLAMRFPADGEGQVYSPPSRICMQIFDLSGELDTLTAYQRVCSEQLQQPFDLAGGDTVRVVLFQLAPCRSRLLLIAHHLVLDGWSLRIALQEIVHFYNASVDASTAHGHWPAARNWRGFVLEQQVRALGEPGRTSLDYWLSVYRDMPEPLALPTDRPRAASIGFAASSLQIPVAAPLWRRLKERARQLKVTRFNLLLCGYALLLHRLTGQNDMVCGIPFSMAAQSHARMLGDTDNTLPLRIAIDPDASLVDTITRMQCRLHEAAAHRDTSLGQIVQALSLKRNTGRFLLAELAFSLVPAIGELKFHGLKSALRPLPRRFVAWEIALHWLQNPDDGLLEVQYRSDLFDACTIAAWMRSYVLVLEQIAEADKLVCEVALASPSDMLRTQGQVISVPPLLDLFAAAFRNHSDRVAAECAGESITYRQLEAQSRAIALSLHEHGIACGDRVGVSLPRSVQMLATLIGILRAGAAYVPLDREYPVERLRYMVEQSGLHVVIGEPESLPPLVATHGLFALDVATLIKNGSVLAAAGNALAPVANDALAYILYTSGSTGKPKGVRIRHHNLANFLVSMRNEPGFSQNDSILAVTTLSFDISALELYLPLICGGTTVIAADAAVNDPLAVCELLVAKSVTVLQTTPALVCLLLEVHKHEVLAGLRLLLGGEALSPALASRLLPLCGELWNLYGPTETTVWSTVARIDVIDGATPIGHAIANTRIYLLDAQRRALPNGAIGEIWIAGAGVADGYQNQPGATADRFVRDPYAGDGSWMYRTGDLGRRREDALYFEGRADHQIKLRGYRIEPGDIESAAAEAAGVRECVAVLRDVDGDQRLVLYLAGRSEDRHLAGRVRVRLAEHLPRYMRPQYLVVLDRLPMTPNGKLDRSSLPNPQKTDAVQRIGGDVDDSLVQMLCELWREMLSVSEVRADDDFFELGGDSLIAVRIFAALGDRHGINLPLAALLQHPTCNELAALIHHQRSCLDTATVPAVPALLLSLVALNKVREGTPIFFIHAIGGHALNYRILAADLGVPAYGLQSPEVAGIDASERSIETMASDYLREIRQVQPQGPYRIAGGSMGGVVAFAIAHQLHDAGQKLDLLALFDTYAPMKAAPVGSGVLAVAMIRLSSWRRYALSLGVGALEALLQRMSLNKVFHQTAEAGLLRSLGLSPYDEMGLQARIERAQANNRRALRRYRAPALAENIYLVLARQGAFRWISPTLGWSRLTTGRLFIDRVNSRHDGIIESTALASLLKARLAPVQKQRE